MATKRVPTLDDADKLPAAFLPATAETVTGAQAKADASVATHSAATTAVHGIADTSLVELTSRKGAVSGYAGLDSSSKLLATNMRPFTARGVATGSTLYNPWDVVTYLGRKILITQTFTSAATTGGAEPFISSVNYVVIGATGRYSAHDFGVFGDGATDSTVALQKAIDYCSQHGGGMVELPQGFIITSATIVLKEFVWLVGQGDFGSVIKLAVNANCHVVKNYVYTGSGQRNAQHCGLLNLRIDGNKTQQDGAGPYYGVYFTSNPINTVGPDQYFDPTHLISGVWVYNTKGTGIYLDGRGDIRVTDTKVSFSVGDGFRSTFDTHFNGCIAEKNTAAGFRLPSSSVQMVGCKSYTNGVGGPTPNEGHGFFVDGFGAGPGEIAFAGCDAQENSAHGFLLQDCHSVVLQGTATASAFTNTGAWAGVALDNSYHCIVDLANVQRANADASAIGIINGSNLNEVRVSHYNNTGGTAPAVMPGSTLTGNSVRVNGSSLTASLAGLVDVQIASPADGQGLAYNAGSGKFQNTSAGSSSFAVGVFGDGSDGAAVLDGTATPAWTTKSGSVYTMIRNAFCTTITISSGVTLLVKGFNIHATTSVTNAGTISADSPDATTSNQTPSGTNGGYGGTGNIAAGSAGQTTAFSPNPAGAGGLGPSGAGGAGGSKGSGTNAIKTPFGILAGQFVIGGTAYNVLGGPGGGGGGGDGTNRGGAGGPGGGTIFVFTPALTNTGTLTAKGGAGFAPTVGNAGGGGGGNGGNIVVYSLSAWTPGTTVVTAGAGGAGVGTGVSGSVGSVGYAVNIVLA